MNCYMVIQYPNNGYTEHTFRADEFWVNSLSDLLGEIPNRFSLSTREDHRQKHTVYSIFLKTAEKNLEHVANYQFKTKGFDAKLLDCDMELGLTN